MKQISQGWERVYSRFQYWKLLLAGGTNARLYMNRLGAHWTCETGEPPWGHCANITAMIKDGDATGMAWVKFTNVTKGETYFDLIPTGLNI
ncbi:hypothetical protein QGP82_14715 [Leptothoe sp. LEGE 181152]|nr:hypothetical protein [Leptothoe sp. LEGE 181152]